MLGAAEVATCTVRCEAQVPAVGFALNNKYRFGHVQRDKAWPGNVRHKAVLQWRGTFCMVESIAVPEHEVVLVPVSVLRLHAKLLHGGAVNGFMVFLGPFADQLQSFPVFLTFVRFKWDPSVFAQGSR